MPHTLYFSNPTDQLEEILMYFGSQAKPFQKIRQKYPSVDFIRMHLSSHDLYYSFEGDRADDIFEDIYTEFPEQRIFLLKSVDIAPEEDVFYTHRYTQYDPIFHKIVLKDIPIDLQKNNIHRIFAPTITIDEREPVDVSSVPHEWFNENASLEQRYYIFAEPEDHERMKAFYGTSDEPLADFNVKDSRVRYRTNGTVALYFTAPFVTPITQLTVTPQARTIHAIKTGAYSEKYHSYEWLFSVNDHYDHIVSDATLWIGENENMRDHFDRFYIHTLEHNFFRLVGTQEQLRRVWDALGGNHHTLSDFACSTGRILRNPKLLYKNGDLIIETETEADDVLYQYLVGLAPDVKITWYTTKPYDEEDFKEDDPTSRTYFVKWLVSEHDPHQRIHTNRKHVVKVPDDHMYDINYLITQEPQELPLMGVEQRLRLFGNLSDMEKAQRIFGDVFDPLGRYNVENATLEQGLDYLLYHFRGKRMMKLLEQAVRDCPKLFTIYTILDRTFDWDTHQRLKEVHSYDPTTQRTH